MSRKLILVHSGYIYILNQSVIQTYKLFVTACFGGLLYCCLNEFREYLGRKDMHATLL
jgi:hypothetical protein